MIVTLATCEKQRSRTLASVSCITIQFVLVVAVVAGNICLATGMGNVFLLVYAKLGPGYDV